MWEVGGELCCPESCISLCSGTCFTERDRRRGEVRRLASAPRSCSGLVGSSPFLCILPSPASSCGNTAAVPLSLSGSSGTAEEGLVRLWGCWLLGSEQKRRTSQRRKWEDWEREGEGRREVGKPLSAAPRGPPALSLLLLLYFLLGSFSGYV